ncbi:uncharacterized protein LOC109852511 [Pseudomyrmex gracilis]|uniref:uncharacterized protein LOC109852511 n=1 Tax=Pseudomyrmex gracilis TaxID=219809 RepID=UPI000995084B|nr:uncharacterized protein LOC109852511 [Pseudomyrmex gracilis]XP_020279314.1 uncharacterized protein LOC109852511 [Pseudomyrmex gracilis]
MTRKCALCKDTNYKNKFSFFSAPKNADLRKKWQNALYRARRNVTVTDDTFVCSRHFDKDDIITHWVSGVPPHVVTIEYKKCRLRPGAVPSRNLHSAASSDTDTADVCKINENVLTLRKGKMSEETFLIPRRERSASDENRNAYYCGYSKSQDYTGEENNDFNNIQLSHVRDTNRENSNACVSNAKESRCRKKETSEALECETSSNLELMNNVAEKRNKKRKVCNMSGVNVLDRTKDFSINEHSFSDRSETAVETSGHSKTTDSSLQPLTGMYMDNEVSLTENYAALDSWDSELCSDDSNMLFEDFLDVCTEVSIPHGWSCLVTSRGHSTTVVYLCMNITDNGLPFVEKQVFLRSDMIAHFVAVNKEIDPLEHSLVKERKHNKVKSLSDVEMLINKFDQRVICQGIYDFNEYEDDDIAKVVCTDGLKWRHMFCPLIVGNDSSRCLKCTTLSRMLRKS